MWDPAKTRFVIIGGKGGVGRTTIAAALATVLASRGRKVLLAHVRTRQRMTKLLGCRKVDTKIRPVEPNLWAVNMNPRAALKERGLMVLRFHFVYRTVMENKLVRHFLKAIPSLNEYSMLGKAWYHTTETVKDAPRFDTVIFDGPATGHLITMLRIPQVILEVVPEGPLTQDARKIQELLVDPQRTSMWIVTLGEEMPVSETLDLHRAAVEDLGIIPDRLVVNALYPDDFEKHPGLSHGLDLLLSRAQHSALGPLLKAAQTLRNRRRINQRYLDDLERELKLPRVDLPHLFVSNIDRQTLERLASELEAALFPEAESPQLSA